MTTKPSKSTYKEVFANANAKTQVNTAVKVAQPAKKSGNTSFEERILQELQEIKKEQEEIKASVKKIVSEDPQAIASQIEVCSVLEY